MWIERSIEPRIHSLAATRPVVVLTGARQTGKTALARRLFPDHRVVSLDLPSIAAQAEHDAATFLESHPPPVVIDEVQYAPGLFRYLKRAVDERRGEPGRFILTGSQPFTLMRGVAESLAGRAAIVEVEGLSLAEIRRARPDVGIEEVILRGGFPELHADPAIEPVEFMHAYVATYLERDLRSQLRVGSLRDFERFVRAAALRTACLVNRAELSRDVAVAGSTAGEWLGLLERGSIVSFLEPWFSNRGKALVKTPKLYVRDTGLAAFLTGIGSVAELRGSPLVGPLWETFVCAELRKSLADAGAGRQLHFWRDRTKEADFLIHAGGRFALADAKWAETPSGTDAARLRRVRDQLPRGRVQRMALICRTAHRHRLSSGDPVPVFALPVEEAAGFATAAT
ncbi:MAG: ATP-binding protein [Planctomycetota bacterium]